MKEFFCRTSYKGNRGITNLAQLISNELGELSQEINYPLVKPWESVVFCKKDDDIIGFIQYFEHDNIITITLSGVTKEHRCQGVYSEMYMILRELAFTNDINAITYLINPEDEYILKHASKNEFNIKRLLSVTDHIYQ